MKNVKDIIDYTEKLARLHIPEDKKQIYEAQFSEILNLVEKLGELGTDDIKPTAHVLNLQNVFREDVAKPSMNRESLLNISPKHNGESVVVPEVIKEDN